MLNCRVGLALFGELEYLEIGNDHVIRNFQPYFLRLLEIQETVVLPVLHALLQHLQLHLLVAHDIVNPTLDHEHLDQQVIDITFHQHMLDFLQFLKGLMR